MNNRKASDISRNPVREIGKTRLKEGLITLCTRLNVHYYILNIDRIKKKAHEKIWSFQED